MYKSLGQSDSRKTLDHFSKAGFPRELLQLGPLSYLQYDNETMTEVYNNSIIYFFIDSEILLKIVLQA